MTASSQLEVCWYRVEYDGEGRPRARHEPTLGRRPGPALARFLRNAKLSRGSIGVDYIINGLSLTDRLNDTCKRPLFDVPGFLANMLPLYWQWRGDDQRGFALELRRLLGEPLTPDDLQPVAQAYKWPEEYVQEHFFGVVQVYGCAHCGDRLCGWWGMTIAQDLERNTVTWSSPNFGEFVFERGRYRQAFAPTLALLHHHQQERTRRDPSAYALWRRRRGLPALP